MPYAVLGSPVEAFASAVLDALLADSTLVGLVGGAAAAATRIVSSLPRHDRTTFPYIVVPQRGLTAGAVAMQKDGGEAYAVIDVWGEKNGAHEVSQIQSRIRAIFPRDLALSVPGYVMYGGSLAFTEELVLPDFDPDMPQRSLFHGVQRLVADLEVA